MHTSWSRLLISSIYLEFFTNQAVAACTGDSCLNALASHTLSASVLCNSLLETTVTSGFALPTYLSGCGSDSPIAKLSSACPCFLSSRADVSGTETAGPLTVTVTEIISLPAITFTTIKIETTTELVTVGCGSSSLSCKTTTVCASWEISTICSTVEQTSSSSLPPALACAVTTSSAPPPPSQTASCNSIINGGFELGDTAYWEPLSPEVSGLLTYGGTGEVVGTTSGVAPYEGSYDWTVSPSCLTPGQPYGLQQTFTTCPGRSEPLAFIGHYRALEGASVCFVQIGWAIPSNGTQSSNEYILNSTSWSNMGIGIYYQYGDSVNVTVWFAGNCSTTGDQMFMDEFQVTGVP